MDNEFLLVESFNKVGFGFSFEEDKVSLIELESRKRRILLDRENEARQKSRATWLLCGDDILFFFFHKYANHRKNVNYIWKIKVILWRVLNLLLGHGFNIWRLYFRMIRIFSYMKL